MLVTEELIALRLAPTARGAGVLGLTVGIALIVNEGFLLILPLVLALFLWWFRSVRQGAVLEGAFLAGVTLGLAPVLLRNVVLGVPPLQLFVSSNVGIALFNASDSSRYFVDPPGLAATNPRSGRRAVSRNPVGLLELVSECRKPGDVLPPQECRCDRPVRSPRERELPLRGRQVSASRSAPTYAVLFPLGAVGLALAEAYGWLGRRRFVPVAAAGAAVLAIWLATRTLERNLVFGGEAPELFRYRPTEFLLGADVLRARGATPRRSPRSRADPTQPQHRGAVGGLAIRRAAAARQA